MTDSLEDFCIKYEIYGERLLRARLIDAGLEPQPQDQLDEFGDER